MFADNTYAAINLDAIGRNLAAVRQKAGVPVMAVVKADAYGHGAVPIARYLEDKCAFFGVSSLAEALELRWADIRIPILILGPVPEKAFPQAVENDIRITVSTPEEARLLSRVARRLGRTAMIHFALDTGMSRIGFPYSETSADLCVQAAGLPGICAEGLFSHYATADCADLTRARAQAERFDSFVEMLRNRGLEIPVCHMSNSAGLMNFSRSYDMVRAGIITYGMYPSDEVDPGLLPLEPALRWCSRISHVALLPPGREIGYGGVYRTEAPTRVATVSAGYADGYRRSLSEKFYVLIHGKKAPILGRVCMDQMMVDVTNIPEAVVGDTVILMGGQGDARISAEEIADKAGSFNYEFVCGISRRVPRYYFLDGQVVHTVHYLLDGQ